MRRTLAQLVLDYAAAHYEEDAWLVYCWSTSAKELDAELCEARIGTVEDAIEYIVHSRLPEIVQWMEQRVKELKEITEP